MLKKFLTHFFVGLFLIPGLICGQEINRKYLDSIIPTLIYNKNDNAVISKSDGTCYAVRKMSPKAVDDLYDYFDKNTGDERVKMVIYFRWGPTTSFGMLII